MKIFSKLLIALILLLQMTGSFANDSLPIFHLSIQNGLSNNSVRCVYQDRKGFMWFGTYDGLNRYDGSEFKIFRNQLSDSSSIPHNYIYTIHEDVFSNLWVGTGHGVAIYNNNSNKFTPAYFFDKITGKAQKMNFNANIINSDDNGNVFVGSNGWGLFLQKPKDKLAKRIALDYPTKNNTDYSVRSITIINNQVWLFILDLGLCKFDINSQKIILVNDKIKSANCMQPDANGNLWIGGELGLYKYVIGLNVYAAEFHENAGQLNAPMITSLCFDDKNLLWIGTDGGGVNLLNIATNNFSYIIPNKNKNNLSSEAVFSIIMDKESRIWIGTVKGGCNIIDEQKSKFLTVASNPLDGNSLPSNFIYSFCEDNAGNLLIGTDGGGLSVWNRNANIFKNYQHGANTPGSISHNSITCIKQDYLGDIWVATFGGGINKFNKSSQSFTQYYCINDSTGFNNLNAWLLFEDREKTLWVTTFSNGKLYRLNRTKNKFEVFTQQFNNLVSFSEDHEGNLWAGNSNQLVRIDKLNKHHLVYEMEKPVRAIYEDTKHNFWMGSEGGGLILFDPKSGKILQRYSVVDGLCNNAVLNIKEDRNGNLWLSTFNGLSKFDPKNKTFKNFYSSDGLQSNQFSYNAALLLKSGEMAVGGISGFNIFNPDNIVVRKYMPSLFITDIIINNKPISEVSNFISQADNAQIQELKIPYNEAVLSLRFNALEYSSPEKIKYAYYLQGWDKDWNYSGTVRNINYNNLHEGSYTLRLRNTNANGEWNPKETVLKIVILAPWYRSWWAYLLYFLIAGALVYLYLRYRAQQTNLKYRVKLIQLNAQKEKEINESRQSFFTNITHEFRTPLTLIINPIKDIIQHENEPGNNKEELNFVYRNARRLLGLVDQLLLFRKTESDTGNMNISRLDFYQLCHETFLYFVQQAKMKNIDYQFDCENKKLEIYGDKDKLEIIFYNLLSNAFKYTPDKGKIIFKVSESEKGIKINISDNGQGIPNHIGDKLFEKYFRVKEKEAAVHPGFGIGLYLVKQFVEKHHGAVSYESQLNQGANFEVVLKKGTAHLGDIEINTVPDSGEQILKEIITGNEVDETISHKSDGLESIISEQHSILITDDNAQMRSYLKQIFQKQFVVYEAENGEQGIKMAKEYMPDVIISDVVMEGATGIDFCKSVKESAVLQHIPFILITGSFSPESKLKGIESGADDYITKPFEKDMLVARVQSLIRQHQNLRKYFFDAITLQKTNLNITEDYKLFLEKCIEIVELHLEDEDFNIQTLAREMNVSHSSLYKKIKTISGQSANAFIRFIRLRKAAEMFINTNYNINETAFYVGIKDIKYFREQFTKLFGLKPSEYIAKYRKSMGKNFKLNDKVIKDK